ncbi:MAG: DUF2182 domain-containing protein [Acetobacteraceae bacterium]|nr:DUF2182 domain-containing protein [Acetobacteraceae bacterium]
MRQTKQVQAVARSEPWFWSYVRWSSDPQERGDSERRQWGLSEAGLLSEPMASATAILADTVLIAAGVYQWTPLKDTCLRHCRSPTEFLAPNWRGGTLGAVRTGTRHGLFCLGCCWMLMALLFVGGLMNLAWIAAIALRVRVEKTVPGGDRMSRFSGALVIVWGRKRLSPDDVKKRTRLIPHRTAHHDDYFCPSRRRAEVPAVPHRGRRRSLMVVKATVMMSF